MLKAPEMPQDVRANRQLVQRYMEAIGSGDAAAAARTLSDEVTLTISGHGPLATTASGPAAMAQMSARIGELTDGRYEVLEHVDLLASQDRVALLAREQATRTIDGVDRTAQFERLMLYRIEHGQIAHITIWEVLNAADGTGRLLVKVAADRRAELLERPGFTPAPYFARHGWLARQLGAHPDWEDVAELLRASYDRVNAKASSTAVDRETVG